jgi:hypothetical protein
VHIFSDFLLVLEKQVIIAAGGFRKAGGSSHAALKNPSVYPGRL